MSAEPSAAVTPAETLALWLGHRERIRATRTKLGLVGYAYLLAMLRDEPATAVILRDRAQLGHNAAYRFLMTLHTLGRLHVAAWKDKPRVPLMPVFAVGAGTDATPPSRRATGRRVEGVVLPRTQLCPSVIAFEHLLRAIEVPASRREVVEATGLDQSSVSDALDALVQLRLAHVPLWLAREQGGDPVAQFQLGHGHSVPAPKVRAAERRSLLRDRQARRRAFQPLQDALRSALFAGVES